VAPILGQYKLIRWASWKYIWILLTLKWILEFNLLFLSLTLIITLTVTVNFDLVLR
jgi:hypothetical protein